jgi:uncharacterized metal-binding protein
MAEEKDMNCAMCGVIKKACRFPDGKGPLTCPTATQKQLIEETLPKYDAVDLAEFAKQASIQEGECYANRDQKPFIMHPTKSRLEETIELAEKMKFKRIGIAFCGGMTAEAAMLAEILKKHDFEVVAVSCKVGGVPKERIGLRDDQKVRVGTFEPMCNPICQAEILNGQNVDFTVMLGLCVGHDSLFLKYAKGLTTAFSVKDRVTGHNPMAALYTSHSYYQRLKKLVFGSDEEIKSRLTARK